MTKKKRSTKTGKVTLADRKKIAAQKLLEIANGYEVKQRKVLRGIRYTETSAHWSGDAHDYSVKL